MSMLGERGRSANFENMATQDKHDRVLLEACLSRGDAPSLVELERRLDVCLARRIAPHSLSLIYICESPLDRADAICPGRTREGKQGADVVGMGFQHLPDLTIPYSIPLPEMPWNHAGKH